MDPAPLPPQRRRFPTKLVLGIFVVLVLLIIGWGLSRKDNNAPRSDSGRLRTVQDVDPQDRTKWPALYNFEITLNGDKKTIKNKEEEASIVVSAEWVPFTNLMQGYLSVILKATLRGPTQQEGSDFHDGIQIIIEKIDNPQNMKLDNWIEEQSFSPKLAITNIGRRLAFEKKEKIQYGSDDEDPIIITESDIRTFYIQGSGATIYAVTCTAAGKDYQKHAAVCRGILNDSLYVP